MTIATRIAGISCAALVALGATACSDGNADQAEPSKDASTPAATGGATQDAAPETSGDKTSSTETSAAETGGGEPLPDPCESLTAAEVKAAVGKEYTTKSVSAGRARLCNYKAADPLSPMISLNLSELGPGVTFEPFAKGVAEAMQSEAEKATINGADDARVIQLKNSGMVVYLIQKGHNIYQLQYAPLDGKDGKATAATLAESLMS